MTTDMGRYRRFSRAAIVVCLSAALAGCDTLPLQPSAMEGSRSAQSPDEVRLRQQGSTFNNTVIEGCMVGSIAGALIGALVSGKQNRGRGAAIGAAAGGALGCGSGWWVAETQQSHAMNEQQLDALAQTLRQENVKLSQLVATSRQVIAEDKKKIARIDRELAAGRLSREQARAEMNSVDSNQQYLSQTLTNLKQQQAEWRQAAQQVRGSGNRQRAAEIDREVAALEKQVAVLEADLDSLAKRRRVSRVG